MKDANKNRPGYSKTKVGWIPSDWEVQRLGLLVNIRSGNSPIIYQPSGEGRFPFIKVDDMNYSYKWQTSAREYSDVDFGVVPQLATLFAKRGAAIAINKVRIARVPLVMDSNMMALIPLQEKINPEFLFCLIRHQKLYRIADTSSIPQINNKHINPYRVPLPSLPEQKKIAEILSTWDEVIEQTRKLIDAKKRRKKALMQQLLTGKKRLPRFAHPQARQLTALGELPGDWPLRGFREIFTKVRRKNDKGLDLVLTASGEHGLIDQQSYFTKSVSARDVSGYYLLRRGEFAYNRSAMAGYPYGAIKRLDRYAHGVLSTLYSCFSLADGDCNSDFYTYFFESGLLNRQLRRITQVGGRAHGLLNIVDSDFFTMLIPVPSEREQQAIAAVIETADEGITCLEAELKTMEKQKRGLMQKLLTGTIRVLN